MKLIPHPRSHPLQPDRKLWLRRFFALLTFGVLSISLLSSAGLLQAEAGAPKRPEQVQGTSVIISEFRTRGSAAGNDEFIELFNPTQNPVDITGWKIVRSTSTGTSPSTRHVFDSVILQPGQYYLVGSLTYSTDVTNTIVQDVIANGGTSGNTVDIGLADGGGLALRRADDSNADQVGIGATAFGEGTRLITELITDVDRGYARVDVCEDNNNNATDFVLTNPSQPQNFSLPATPCPAPTATPPWERRIIINEVAWGGTQADDTLAQWIELYNPSSTETISFDTGTGWYLRIPGKGDIPLQGVIPPNSYYLIERNQSDTNVNTIVYPPIVSDPTPTLDPLFTPGIVYAFPFLNVNGDSLYLYSDTDDLVDSANSNGGSWPAGNRFAFYHSMERRSNEPDTDPAWLTFNGTLVALDRLGNSINGSPGQPNSPGLVSTPTYTPTSTFTPTLTFTPTSTFTPTQTLTPSLTPTLSGLRSIIINEVAWMGTIASETDEWIELYNPGTVSVNITGWTLSSGTTFSVTLGNYTIPPGGYFLLERTDNDTIKDIDADQIFTGSLTNTGMSLSLRTTSSSSSQLIDTANSNGGVWPAGNSDADKRCSMERRGSSLVDSDTAWITNTGVLKNGTDAGDNLICGTPRNANWAYIVTPTPSPISSAVPTRTPTKTRTPTRIPAASISQIIINEFLPHSRSDWNKDGVIDSGDEFIELMNVGNASGSLEGWRLDDQEGDSSPYTLSGVSLAPGAKVVFFASETGLLLSNRSDSVRILKANGVISDAFTYTTVPVPDQTWCRLPDGKPTWVFGCQPTLSQINQLAKTIYRGEVDMPAICESPELPVSIYLAECMPSGLGSWSRRLWDDLQPIFRVLVERHGQEYWIE